MKIGTDVLEINRIKTDEKFLEKFLNKQEIEYINNFNKSKERIAGFFCCKEAVFKALDMKIFKPHEIIISHHKNGKPYITLTGNSLKHFKNQNYKNIDISISHSKTIAQAVCIIH